MERRAKRWFLVLSLLSIVPACTASLGCVGPAAIPSGPTVIVPSSSRPDGAKLVYAPERLASAQNPVFSPDGKRRVFTRFENGYNRGPAGLFLLDLGSGQDFGVLSRTVTRLTPDEDQDNVNLPGAAWNAFNDRIVFASDRLEADDLWRIAPDGSDLSRITAHSGPPWYIEPSWSPDGRWIVFESHEGQDKDTPAGLWRIAVPEGVCGGGNSHVYLPPITSSVKRKT